MKLQIFLEVHFMIMLNKILHLNLEELINSVEAINDAVLLK